MSFTAQCQVEDRIATLHVSGELHTESVGELDALIRSAAEEDLERLVLHMGELTYMSSAGLRSIVFAHQRLGRGVEIVLVDTRPEVAETIRLTGLDRSVVMQGSRDVP